MTNNLNYSRSTPCLVGARSGRAAHVGRPFTADLVLLLANFLPGTLASKRSFHTLFLPRLQVKGVALDLFNDVFLLHLALETPQSVFEGFPLLQPNFRQTDTPPNPSGRTR